MLTTLTRLLLNKLTKLNKHTKTNKTLLKTPKTRLKTQTKREQLHSLLLAYQEDRIHKSIGGLNELYALNNGIS